MSDTDTRNDLVFICETRCFDVGDLSDRLGFRNCCIQPTAGYSGGLFLGRKPSIQIDMLSVSNSCIVASVLDAVVGKIFILFCCYWHAKRCDRVMDIQQIYWLFPQFKRSSLIMGDFNIALSIEEKYGGTWNSSYRLWEYWDRLCLCALGFDGYLFTWSNFQDGEYRIQERLDHFAACVKWMSDYPSAKVSHLAPFDSDHLPLLMDTAKMTSFSPKPFRFSNYWVMDNEYNRIVSKAWKSHVVGSLLYRVVSKFSSVKVGRGNDMNLDFGISMITFLISDPL